MNQGQRFNPINQVPFNGPYVQPHPLKQHFNHGVHQPFGVPQQFHNQSTYNNRSWIDKAVAYRAFMQNQQAPQPNNQHQVQANYQRDQLTHAPYSLAPFGPPNSVNQHPFNYPRGAINPPQAFNARAQSNQQSSTGNAFRNFQPVLSNPEAVSYGHQIKPSFSPGYNQGFVAQRKPIQPYAKLDVVDSEYFLRQGYKVENQNRKSDVNSFDTETAIYNAKIEKLELRLKLIENIKKIYSSLDNQDIKESSRNDLTLKADRMVEIINMDPCYQEAMRMADYSRSQLLSGSKDNLDPPSTNPSSKEVQPLQEKQYKMLCQQF